MIGRVLVIKLSALGDFIQAMGPFKAIRDHHKGAHITLLTTKAYADLAKASPYFDDVWVDERAPRWRLDKLGALGKRLNGGGFERVYDLQTSNRSSSYFKLFKAKPEWSGIATGCSHPHANADRDYMHTQDRQAEQLAMAGVAHAPSPDLSWMEADVARFDLPSDYILLAPGGAPHRPGKRWSVESYGDLAVALAGTGRTPVLLGTTTEREEIQLIKAACPVALDLSNQTSFIDIAVLARKAKAAVGNDTGPMHLIAETGCQSIVLYSHESDPSLCAQRGDNVTIIRKESLADVTVEDVIQAL